MRLDQGENGKIPEVDQGVLVPGTPPLVTTKEEFVGPKIIQPPEGKKPHIKPFEIGGGAQWPTKPITSTPSKNTSSMAGQPPRKSAQGAFNVRGKGSKNGQGEEQLPPRPPPRESGRGRGNDNGGGDDDGDDNDEEEDDEDTDRVTESENGEDLNAPGGRHVPGAPGGGGDGPPPNLGVRNVGPRGRRGHRGQRG